MPEGDTIRHLAERITARFAGQRVERCVTRDPRLVGLDLSGAVLREADAVGKHLMLRFDNGRTLHSHLRMDGEWTVGRAARVPEWRRRVELWMEDGRLTAVDMPMIGVIATADEADVVGHLGIDLCAAVVPEPAEVADRLVIDPTRPLAGALLDQRLVAGFGNVFAVEVPFIAGVSPQQPVGDVVGLDGLVAIGAALIRHSMRGGPRNTTGRRLNTADHWIYGKSGRPCGLCGTRLEGWTDRESPWGRFSVWCPECQRLESPRVADLIRARRLLGLHPARREPPFPPAN